MDAVARRPHDFGHVCPDAVPAWAAEPPAIALPLDRHRAQRCLRQDGFDQLRRQIGVAPRLPLGVVANGDRPGVLDGAAQAADAMLRPRRKAAHRPRENAVDAGARGDHVPVAPVFPRLLHQQLQQLDAVDLDEKAVRQVGQVGRRRGVDMVTAIADRQSGRCVTLQLLITRFGHRHK